MQWQLIAQFTFTPNRNLYNATITALFGAFKRE
jgi:hypothetical protein